MTNIKIDSRILLFAIVVLHCVLYGRATKHNTLTLKEDLTNISLSENSDIKSEDKSKRDLPPKLQEKVINILNPVPVVDTITEAEKYGNTGDKFYRLGRGLVSGVETVGNLINKAISFPTEAVKKLSRSTTEALNNLGGKLVGLQ